MDIPQDLQKIGVYEGDNGKWRLSPQTFASHISYRYKVIFTPSQQFYLYDGSVYKEFSVDKFKSMLYKELASYGVECLWHIMIEKNYIAALKHLNFYGKPLNPYTQYINLKNGMLNTKTLKLVKHKPKFYSTVQLPIEYDTKAQCPEFQKFLQGVFQNDKELMKVVQEIMGYCISTDNHAQRFFVFYGDGANGKSLLCNVMKRLVGKKFCTSIPISGLSNSFARAQLKDKILNISTENEPPNKLGYNSEYIKKISGGDDIQAEFKGKDAFSFRPFCKLVFAVNTLPQFRDKTYGFLRRIMIVPFYATFSIADGTADIHLEEKLQNELPGILNWALEGLLRLRKNNYQFTKCTAMDALMDEYSKDINPYIVFWQEEVVEHKKTDNVRMKRTEFYQTFLAWCATNNHANLAKVTPRKFWNDIKLMISQLKLTPLDCIKTGGEWYVKNLSIKDHVHRLPLRTTKRNTLDFTYNADDDFEEDDEI